MAKFRTKLSMGKIVQSRMELMKTWDKKEALTIMLPQRIEENILYNFKNEVIGGCDGKDCIFHEDATIITENNRITDKFLNALYGPIEAYFGYEAEEVAEEVTEEVTEEVAEEVTEEIKFDLVTEITVLIEEDLKGAKKLLKASKDHADYKAAKKLYKEAV